MGTSKVPQRFVMALLALAAAFSAPSKAASEESGEPSRTWSLSAEGPWAADAPGVAGSRFGLGLESFFEHQESLRFRFLETSIRLSNLLEGAEETSRIPGDPELLNRKFDLVLELTGVGATLPIALPHLGPLYPTLIFEAAEADLDLRFEDLNRAEDSHSLSGRGSVLGGGLDVTASLCRSCNWFVASGYRYRQLLRTAVDRSPSFALPDFEVLADDVRLESEFQDVSARVGYGFPGNRIATYVGVSRRQTDVTAEDELRYVDPLRELETTLSSRTEWESETTHALAGVQARLPGSFYAKLETHRNEDNDWGVLAQVVYLMRGGKDNDEEHKDEQDPRAREIARAIASELAAIERDFVEGEDPAGWKNLNQVTGPDGRPAYFAQDVQNLLNRTEGNILAVLGRYPELKALGDWVSDEFDAARSALGLGSPRPKIAGPTSAARAALETSVRTIFKDLVDAVLGGSGRAGNAVAKPKQWSQNEQLQLDLTFRSRLGAGTRIFIYPMDDRNSPHARTLARDSTQRVYKGTYSFEVSRGTQAVLSCDAKGKRSEGGPPCPLDLCTKRCPIVECDNNECRQCTP